MCRLAVLLFLAAAFLLAVALVLGCIAADPADRPLAGFLAAAFTVCAGIVIAGGVWLL